MIILINLLTMNSAILCMVGTVEDDDVVANNNSTVVVSKLSPTFVFCFFFICLKVINVLEIFFIPYNTRWINYLDAKSQIPWFNTCMRKTFSIKTIIMNCMIQLF